MTEEGLGITSIKVMVGAVKSFFKYSDLPLGIIPQSMSGIIYHNKDITKEEIVHIMAISKIREKTIEKLKEQISNKDQKLQELEQKMMKFEPLFELLSDNTNNLERLLKDLEQGRYAKVESERSLTLQIPKTVI